MIVCSLWCKRLARRHACRARFMSKHLSTSPTQQEVPVVERQQPSAGTLQHLTMPGSHLHPLWVRHLLRAQKPLVRTLAATQIVPGNALGFQPNFPSAAPIKPGTLLHYVLAAKQACPTRVVLVRCGDFYEAYGVDALLLMEHAGLNAMGGRARAGCPVQNVQAALDGLVSAGLVVAVHEERLPVTSTMGRRRPAKKHQASVKEVVRSSSSSLKERYLSQVVSPSQPLYLHDLCLRGSEVGEGSMGRSGGGDQADVRVDGGRPFVGLLRNAHGYSLSLTYSAARTSRVFGRLTLEGLKSLLQTHTDGTAWLWGAGGVEGPGGGGETGFSRSGFSRPVFVQGLGGDDLRSIFGPLAQNCIVPEASSDDESPDQLFQRTSGYSEQQFHRQVRHRVSRLLAASASSKPPAFSSSAWDLGGATGEATDSDPTPMRPRPVYINTALQIGLLPNANVPDLLQQAMGFQQNAPSADNAAAAEPLNAANAALCVRFMREWLMCPPSERDAGCMRAICFGLSVLGQGQGQGLEAPLSHFRIPLYYNSLSGGGSGSRLLSYGKISSLIYAKQCNVVVFTQIHSAVRAVVDLTTQLNDGKMAGNVDVQVQQAGFGLCLEGLKAQMREAESHRGGHMNVVLGALHRVVQSLCRGGASAPGEDDNVIAFGDRCRGLLDLIEGSVFIGSEGEGRRERPGSAVSSDPDGHVPAEFFRQNEAAFRGRVALNHEEMSQQLNKIDSLASKLCTTVRSDLISSRSVSVVFDSVNNRLYARRVPGRRKQRSAEAVGDDIGAIVAAHTEEEEAVNAEAATVPVEIAVRDKRGTAMPHCFTSAAVEAALGEYLDECAASADLVVRVYQGLCAQLAAEKSMALLRGVAQWNVVLTACMAHVRAARRLQWSLPTVILPPRPTLEQDGESEADAALELPGLVPYWMQGHSGSGAVRNDVSMNGLFLLTAPNMSGKSTLMRSVLVATLLANCGLFVPCIDPRCQPQRHIVVPFYSQYFMRATSYDSPSSAQSALALEMDDLSVLLRECCPTVEAREARSSGGAGQRSMVMIDELGKGTSSRDGSSLAGAVVEELSRPSHNISGIFATHLHELLMLPLSFGARRDGSSTVQYKTMGVDASDGGDSGGAVRWTYLLRDGICVDSLAMHAARAYSLPPHLVRRADQLSRVYDEKLFDFKANLAASGVSTATAVSTTDASSSPTPVGLEAMQPLIREIMRGRQSEDASAVPWVTSLLDVLSDTPPPSSEGRHCVYVLQLQGAAEEVASYYVGETASIHQRFRQHRKKFKDMKTLRALILQPAEGTPVAQNNRSTARVLESRIVGQLKSQLGLPVVSGGRAGRRPSEDHRKLF